MYQLVHEILEKGNLHLSESMLYVMHVDRNDIVELHYYNKDLYICGVNTNFEFPFSNDKDHYQTTVKLSDFKLSFPQDVLIATNLHEQSSIVISPNRGYLRINAEKDYCIICGNMDDLVRAPIISDDVKECLCTNCINKIKMIQI